MLKIIVFTSGEQIITELKPSVSGGEIIITNPMRLLPQPDGKLGMMPWIVGSDEKEITIKTEFIMTMVNPDGKLEKIYTDKHSILKQAPPVVKTIIGKTN